MDLKCNRYKCENASTVIEVITLEGKKYLCNDCCPELEAYLRQQREGFTRYGLHQKITEFFYSEKGHPIRLYAGNIIREFQDLVKPYFS